MTGATSAPLAGAILTVDLDAIAHNWRALRDHMAAAGECSAVLKADAYGLGIDRVAPVLWDAGCRVYFVALPQEGIALRAVLPRGARIVVLDGLFADAIGEYVAHRLIPTLNRPDEIDRWRDQAREIGRPLPAVLHIDTGMNRLGLGDRECTALLGSMDRLNGVDIQALMTHLTAADDPTSPLTDTQVAAFRAWQARFADVGLRAWGSIANSAGLLLHPKTHADLARPGIALYGCAPDPARAKEQTHGLRPVVSLRARVLQVRHVDTPQTVGYGAAYRVSGPTRIATVAIGYADGLLRSIGGAEGTGGAGYLNGHRVPLAGRISMDLSTFDATNVPEALCRPGDWVEVIGSSHDVDAIALDAGTIGYEVLTRLGHRFKRDYVGGQPAGAGFMSDAAQLDAVTEASA